MASTEPLSVTIGVGSLVATGALLVNSLVVSMLPDGIASEFTAVVSGATTESPDSLLELSSASVELVELNSVAVPS